MLSGKKISIFQLCKDQLSLNFNMLPSPNLSLSNLTQYQIFNKFYITLYISRLYRQSQVTMLPDTSGYPLGWAE